MDVNTLGSLLNYFGLHGLRTEDNVEYANVI